MIKIRGLKKSFGNLEILKGVDLDAIEGKTTVIFGVSGGGKSTIIKHIVGLLKPNSGSIFVDGKDIVTLNEKELRVERKNIGFLFQNGALFDSMNVFDNVAFPLVEHTNMSKKEIEKIVFEKLEMVGLNPIRVTKLFPDELSGGMKKRVGLARTIALNPKILLYDEPTSGLDPVTSDLISTMIKTLQNEIKTTSILISHDVKESFKVGDYFAMLFDGKIVEYADNESFKNSKNEVVRQFIDGLSEGPIEF
ncbi:MAG: ABC transporter ATP-binding protein [Campylobacterales bacterium]|nr:ABC transporter ATP-binding protein [Campylobacterales bacterium]